MYYKITAYRDIWHPLCSAVSHSCDRGSYRHNASKKLKEWDVRVRQEQYVCFFCNSTEFLDLLLSNKYLLSGVRMFTIPSNQYLEEKDNLNQVATKIQLVQNYDPEWPYRVHLDPYQMTSDYPSKAAREEWFTNLKEFVAWQDGLQMVMDEFDKVMFSQRITVKAQNEQAIMTIMLHEQETITNVIKHIKKV
jgi:hypothetical protein